MSNTNISPKLTVRELKKRSKKSRTLPSRRFKSPIASEAIFTSSENINNNNNICSLHPNININNNAGSVFSISQTENGSDWCFDMDAYGIYLDYSNGNSPISLRDNYHQYRNENVEAVVSEDACNVNENEDSDERVSGCGGGTVGGSVLSLKGTSSLSRSILNRMDFKGKFGGGTSNNNGGCVSKSGTLRSLKSTKSSRSKLYNSTFTHCFGLGNSNTPALENGIQSPSPGEKEEEGDEDEEAYCKAAHLNDDKNSISQHSTPNKNKSISKKKRKETEKKQQQTTDEDYEDEDERNYASDTSYDKACGSEQRRGSAPLTPVLGSRETPSQRFANFFSKRSFKSNPLKRTKSVTKLERNKKVPGSDLQESSSSGLLYSSRLRTSRSHESLLAWTNHSAVNNLVNSMMMTLDLSTSFGDVSIRPLHPSILGQDYTFSINTPSGSKYFSCSSSAERDSWVHALRQCIKPYADEVRRQENSLKIWILEAKGVAGGSTKNSSKRYFCELYLDEVLYARTCGKTKGEMLFWGEHFEFSSLPNCVQLITVVFYREGDKKRKKERNTCLGRVKINVNSVNSRSLIEKWYPVIPETNSSQSSSKEVKDGPSLRVKCKFQSVDILPIRCYNTFLKYIKDEFGILCECLEGVLSVKAKEELANALVHLVHHEGIAKEFIAELALQEILKSGDDKLTFRGNSIATKAMESFLKLTGSDYLHATLGSFIENFQVSEDIIDCEIDPMKLSTSKSANEGLDRLAKNQQNLRMAIDHVWKQILNSVNYFPMELRECFSHCREALKSAGKEELSDHLISASIFLRLLCPAILSPSLFDITNEYPTEKSARNLTLIAKVLQTLANFTRFQGKENYMEFINDFVEREATNMKSFLGHISSPHPDAKKSQKENQNVPAGGFIDLGKYMSILSTLLSESVGKIAPKNDRFQKLLQELTSIDMWLKQPPNATNVSIFPFPHLAPPPQQSPPAPPVSIPMNINHRNSGSFSNNGLGLGNQYQIPHSASGNSPIYAVSNVIHNISNPNVKNISQIQMNMTNPQPVPLQLQIPIPPHNGLHNTQINGGNGLNNNRSGSQTSGYQSQSPVLEGDDQKAKKLEAIHQANIINNNILNNNTNNNINNGNGNNSPAKSEGKDGSKPVNFCHPIYNRKSGSQSVDDLTSIGIDSSKEIGYKKRLTRSSSSSDSEYAPSNHSSTRNKLKHKGAVGVQVTNGKVHSKNHHRLSRRSSAELLKKNHPYSSSTDEDSDSGHVNEKDEAVPQLPPRRYAKRNSGYNNNCRNSILETNGAEKSLEEYEREMLDLRKAMEALQVKLNRAEERLFGHDTPLPLPTSPNGQLLELSFPNGCRMQSPIGVNGNLNENGDRNGSLSSDENTKEMDRLLQRLLSAEEEVKREQQLLSALDKKQKLIDAQEQKIAHLDSVNNQLLSALAQIRDNIQQQHFHAQQQKIQLQLQKQQQHLKSLSNGYANNPNINNSRNYHPHQHPSIQNQNLSCQQQPSSQVYQSNGIVNGNINCNINNNNNGSNNSSPGLSGSHCSQRAYHNNTTKVLINSDKESSPNDDSLEEDENSNHSNHINNRDSSIILGEQALKMLAELKSSSC